MTRQEIHRAIRDLHPEATNIYPNDFGNWNADIEHGTMLTIRTYRVRGQELEWICETTAENLG